jgi:ABC-type glutathione transport system ATPase component
VRNRSPIIVQHSSIDQPPLLSVRDLRVHFPLRGGVVKAVDGVTFEIQPGTTLGLVGESGSGKSTVGRAVLRLIPVTAGTIAFDGVDVLAASRSRIRTLRRQMQIVFQDPAGSLNPRMRVGEIVGEPLLVHGLAKGEDVRKQVASLLERCGSPRAIPMSSPAASGSASASPAPSRCGPN